MGYESGDCSCANYKLRDDGKLTVMNNEYFFDKEEWGGASGTARHVDNGTDGHLEVKFNIFSPWGPYNLVETDYETYSLVYGCIKSNITGKSNEQMWILSRTPELPEETLDHIKSVVQEKIPSMYPIEDYMYNTVQGDDCSYEEQPEFSSTLIRDLFIQ